MRRPRGARATRGRSPAALCAALAAALGAALAACATRPSPTPSPPPAPAPGPGPGGAPPAPAPRGGGAFYRPTPGLAYAYQRRDSLTLELPGGATQVQQFNRTAYLTVTIAEGSGAGRGGGGAAAGGEAGGVYQATIRLDSLRQDPGGTVPPDSLLRAEGTTWTGSLTPRGHLGALQADRPGAVADQMEASLAALFPALPAQGLQPGATWTDTTERKLKADAFDATERAVTTYRAVKADGGVITIEGATTFQRSGTGGQAAQPMEMVAQGVRRGVYRFASDGAVVSGEGADSAEMTITIPAVGQTVPVSRRATWKFTSLSRGR